MPIRVVGYNLNESEENRAILTPQVKARANGRIRTSDQTPQAFAIRVSLNLLSYISFEPVEGLEPPTSALQVRHSAN